MLTQERGAGVDLRSRGVFVFFSAATLLLTWPQVTQPAGILEHRDSWFNMWRIGWFAHQSLANPAQLFDANIFYPVTSTLAFSDAVLLPAAIAAPFIWLGAPIPLAHTGLVLGSFLFAGMAMWMLVRSLTGSSLAGVIAGTSFAFAPYRFDHYMHLELLWGGWMPLCLLAVHRLFTTASIRAGVASGLLFAAQALSSIYYGVLFAVACTPLLAVMATSIRRVAAVRLIAGLVTGGLVAAAILLPYMAPYRAARDLVGERSHDEALLYSAGPTHYLAARDGHPVYGALAQRFGRAEKHLFPGLIALGCVLAAVISGPRRPLLAYLLALAFAIDLSLGPRGLTFEWLREHVDVFRGLRAPARAGALSLLFLSVLVGYGAARIERRLPARSARFLAVLPLVMLLEYLGAPLPLVSAPLQADAARAWLAEQPAGVVAELPLPSRTSLPGHDPQFAYLSTFHWHHLVNGYSGNVPPSYEALVAAAEAAPFGVPVDHLRAMGVRYVVLNERYFESVSYDAAVSELTGRRDLRAQKSFGTAGQRSAIFEILPPQ